MAVRAKGAENLRSMVHFQRNALTVVLFELERKTGYPYRVTLMPTTSHLEPYKHIMPLDMFVDFGHDYSDTTKEKLRHYNAYSEPMFHKLFDKWIKKCDLGTNALGGDSSYLGLFTNMQQYRIAQDIWGTSLGDWLIQPVRIFETIIAFENDKRGMRGLLPHFGKNTWTQCSAKIGKQVDRTSEGAQRCAYMLEAYKRLTTTYQVVWKDQ